MSELITDIETFYINQSLATADGTDIFRNFMPDSPDNCIALMEYAGEVSFITSMANRSIQVRVRNLVYETGRTKILSLYKAVYDPESDVRIVDFTAGRFGIVKPRNYPYMLNRDESERFNFIFNMGVVTPQDS